MDGDGRAIPLSRLRGHRLMAGALDVRGWDVCSADGRRVGDVHDVLVDCASMEVRYLDVEVENVVVTGRERHVLVPLSHARRDPARRRTVVVEGLAARSVPRLPSYARGTAAGADTRALARLLRDMEPDSAHVPLDGPIRVEPPLIIRPIRLPAAPAPAPAQPAGPASADAAATPRGEREATLTARAGTRAA
ncbi:PRC-barrel domain-containing protein [Longimicrobium sp.]|uniref:PRC-barrel domain-containing protein n=1 Tax=Longimicrobium sp. TaxID=2029185 RepID=UPI002E2F6E19|nr:PRC-barrel domain-containing protein [Longimicrobium sp.]HEX6036776.1 PRC-barrel domain-containing protein [Longimicrobium sp.]